MSSSFWSNTIWYLLLGITSIIEIIFIFAKAQNRRRVLALFISILGMVFAIEIPIASVLHAYHYIPKIIPQSTYDDGIVGNYFSQFSITSTIMLIAVYKLKYYWYFIFSGIYFLIEILFLKLNIYVTNWYRPWMTFVGFPLVLWTGVKIYLRGLKHIRPIPLYFYVFLSLITLQIHTLWIFRILGIFSFGSDLHVPPKKATVDTLISIAYMLIAFSAMIAVYYSKIKGWWKALTILGLYIAHYIAYKAHLMYFKEGWFFIFTTISLIFLYLYIFIVDKLYRRDRGTDLLSRLTD